LDEVFVIVLVVGVLFPVIEDFFKGFGLFVLVLNFRLNVFTGLQFFWFFFLNSFLVAVAVALLVILTFVFVF